MTTRLPMQALAAMILAVAGVSAAHAATATAQYSVHVPLVLSITGPADQTITHDGTDNDQAFVTSNWVVACNDPDGATMTLAVNDVFANTANPGYKRDVRMQLAVAGSDSQAAWEVTAAADQTRMANSDTNASVQAASTAAGQATFALTLTLIETDHSTLAAGDYTTTVTATVTGN